MKRRIAMILALLMCLSLVFSALPAMAGAASDAPAAAPERKLSLRLLENVAGKADDELIFLNVFLKGLSDADLAAMLPMPAPDDSASSAELSAYANAKHELKQRIYPGIADAFVRKYLTEPERVGNKYYQNLPGFQGYVKKSKLLELAALDEVVWMNYNYSVYIVPEPAPQTKLAAPLLAYMETAPDGEGIPVRLWLRGANTQEIEALTPVSYPTPDSTREEIQAYRAAYRQASTDFQNDRYGLFARQHLDENDEILYQPEAVKIPVMVVKATKAKLAELASLRFVSRIDPAFGYDEAFPDPELPEDEGALNKLDAQLREFMKLASHDELISVEIDLAKPTDAAIAVMGAMPDPTDLFVQSYLDETDEIISKNASASRVTALVPKYKLAALAALDEVTAIRWYLGSNSLTVMESDPVYLSPEDGTSNYNVVNFTVPNAGKYEIVGQSKSEVTEGVGLTMTANRQKVYLNTDPPVIGEDAYAPEDLVKVPVSGDWTATLLFGFDPGASGGYYESFYFLAMQGEDYKNLAGIFGLFDGFRDYLFRDGEYLGTPDSVAVNDSGLAGSDTHWLRIDKTGDSYVCSASADGRTFIELFSLDDTGVNADYLIIDAYSWMFTGYTYTLRSLAIEQKGQSAVPPVNYDALRQAIAEAEKLNLNDYTSASADAVDTALQYARQALNAASQQEADAAAQALNAAVAALVVRQALDFSEVNALAARVDAVYQSPEKYTEESLREFMRLEQRVSIDDLVMEEEQAAIDYAAQCLREALAALVPVREEPDPEVLKKLDPYLLEQMEKAPDNAKIPIDVTLATPSEEEILAQIDVPVPGAGATLEEVNAYNSAMRKAKRAVYSAITSAFAEDHLDENDTVRFRGNYIPTLIIEVPMPKVLSLAALEEVTHVGWADGYTILYPMDPVTPDPPEGPDYTSKLDPYLIEQMEKEPDDAFIPISIMLEGPSQEKIKEMLPIPEPDIHSNVTLEEVEAYISAKRELSRELYSAITDAFVQEHLDENDTIRFCGRYIPSVTVEVPKQKVYTLAALENVTSIGWADRNTSIYPTVPLWPNLPAEFENKITQALKDYATPLPDDTRIPLRFDLREPDEALIERIVSATVPKPGEDASQEEIDAYNAAYREKWREQISVRTGAFVNYRLEETETVYYIGEDTAVVICEVPKSRIAYLASVDEVLQIDLAGSYLDPPPCEHDYQAVVTAPTCTEAGYTTYTCSKCGDSYRGGETAALGHSTYRTVVTPPTCTEPGFTTYTCTRCGDSFTGSETQALGHSYRTVVTPPTCTEAGYTTYTCFKCGDSYTGSETEALGHSYRTVATPATCTEPGFTTYTCTRCGDSYTGSETEALGHDYQDGVCTRCGKVDLNVPPAQKKISLSALELMAEASDDALIPISIGLKEPSDAEIEALIPLPKPDASATEEEINAYADAKAKTRNNVYTGLADAFAQKYLDATEEITARRLTYSAGLKAKVRKSKIAVLAALDEVIRITPSGESFYLVPAKSPQEKIDETLRGYLETAADNERIPIRLWLRGQRDEEAEVLTGLRYPDAAASLEEVRTYQTAFLQAKRSMSGDPYSVFAGNRLDGNDEILFQSSLIPVMIVRVPKAKIAALAELQIVSKIDPAFYFEGAQPLPTEDSAVLNKMNRLLREFLEIASEDDRIPVSFRMKEPTKEEIEALIPISEPGSDATQEEKDAYRAAKNAAQKQAYSAITDGFVQNHLDASDEVLYKGSYTTTVTALVSRAKAVELAALEEVSSLTWNVEYNDPLVPGSGEPVTVPAQPAQPEKDPAVYGALSPYLFGFIENLPDGEGVPVALWLKSPSDEELEATVPVEYPGDDATMEEISAYLTARRRAISAVITAITDAFVQDHLDENDEIIFQSHMVPTVFAVVPKAKVLSLAALDEVLWIEYYENNASTAVPTITVADKRALLREIEEPLPPMEFTVETSIVYHEVWQKADAVYQNTYATQEEVDAAAEELRQARTALKAPVYDALNAAIAGAEAIDRSKYSAESLAALDQALAAAKSVSRDSLSQTEIDAAAQALTDAVEALGFMPPPTCEDGAHEYENTVTPPTCTAAGYTYYVCTKCGYSYTSDEVPALGHDFQNGVCTRCGETEATYVPGGEPPEYRTANSVDEMLAWIKAERAKPAETWGDWARFLNEANKLSRFLTVHPAAEDCSLEKVMVSTGPFSMDYFFRSGEDRIEVIVYPLNTTLDAYMAQVIDSRAEEYEDFRYTKAAAKIDSKDSAIYYADGGYYTKKDTGEKELLGPSAFYECKGHLVVIRGVGSLNGAKWDDAWLDLFRYELVDLKEHSFDDVQNSTLYYYDPVYWAVEQGITKGTSEKQFSPDAGCTRAQVVTFLWRAAGEPEPAKTDNPFADVKPGAYYYKAVLWAVEQGITTGTSPTTFRPDQTCTRAQIVTFLWRSVGKPQFTIDGCDFLDVDDCAYYYGAIQWAIEKGITKGTSGITFSPDATCTRAQIVTFLYRAQPKEAAPVCEHEYVKGETAEPTCAKPGGTTYTCSKCGDSYFLEETPALGHDFVNGVCTRCGEQESD